MVCGFFFVVGFFVFFLGGGMGVSLYVTLVELHIDCFHILCDQISINLKEIFKIPLLTFSNLILTECWVNVLP